MTYENPIKHILVPTDFSDQANNALRLACDIARKTKADITLLTVVDYPGGSAFSTLSVGTSDPTENKYIQDLLKEIEANIEEIPSDIDTEGINLIKKVQVGNPFTHIQDEINHNDSDLVIMGSKGSSGIDEVFLGSNTERVVRRAKVPLITVKQKVNLNDIQKILFATSLDEDDAQLVEKVKQLQSILDAKIFFTFINTPTNFRRSRTTSGMMRDLATKYMFKDYELHTFNDVTEEDGIIHAAEEFDVDMIALATHGRTGLAHLLGGSIAEDVVNHARRPVWTFNLK